MYKRYAYITGLARHTEQGGSLPRVWANTTKDKACESTLKGGGVVYRGKEWSFAEESLFSHWAFSYMKALVQVMLCPQNHSPESSSPQPSVPSKGWGCDIFPLGYPLALLGTSRLSPHFIGCRILRMLSGHPSSLPDVTIERCLIRWP